MTRSRGPGRRDNPIITGTVTCAFPWQRAGQGAAAPAVVTATNLGPGSLAVNTLAAHSVTAVPVTDADGSSRPAVTMTVSAHRGGRLRLQVQAWTLN